MVKVTIKVPARRITIRTTRRVTVTRRTTRRR